MDTRVIKRIKKIFKVGGSATADDLVDAIFQVSADRPLSVNDAESNLSAVLERARDNAPQFIGNSKRPQDLAVVLSVKDLVELVGALRHQQTLGEALDAEGFKPYPVRRIIVGQGRHREPLSK